MKGFRMLMAGVFVLFGCAAGALAQSIQTDYDHNFNLARLKSFGFYQQLRRPGDVLASNQINDRRIHDALESELTGSGFTASNQPDFWIVYSVTTRKGLDIQDNRFGIFQRMGSVNVNETTAGTLVVAFIDSATKQEVWRGYASGDINPKDLNKDVTKSIAKLIQKFKKNQAGQK